MGAGIQVSLIRAIKRAYSVMSERNWDTVYWAVDLHGTVITSNYESGTYEYICEEAKLALQAISDLPETKLILWSSMYEADQDNITNLLRSDGIRVEWFNENPDAQNTATGCFDQKFYFSVLVDDKAGFDPSEWTEVQATTLQLSEAFHNEKK